MNNLSYLLSVRQQQYQTGILKPEQKKILQQTCKRNFYLHLTTMLKKTNSFLQ